MDLSNIDSWVFDLDNTLYSPEEEIFSQIDKKMTEFVISKFNVDEEEAFNIQKKYFLEYGTTLSGLMKRKNIDPDEFLEFVHDINLVLKEGDVTMTAETIRAIVVLAQMNLHIWHNESNYRKGIEDGNNLELTHGLNGIRNTSKNKVQEVVGGRKDYKIDCLAADFKDWEISWDE